MQRHSRKALRHAATDAAAIAGHHRGPTRIGPTMKLQRIVAAPLLAVLHAVAVAQPAPSAPTVPPPAPCTGNAYRAFDFWLGDWEVRAPDGRLFGHNRIEAGYGGCVVHERYTTAAGYRGESLNGYDRNLGTWHQTFMDNAGLVLRLEGGPADGGMLLEGEGKARDGTRIRHRVRWSVEPDGRIRQRWDTRRGDNPEWTLVFEGLYQRR
jgi:hypothetical protein